jgi:hypothetical protein
MDEAASRVKIRKSGYWWLDGATYAAEKRHPQPKPVARARQSTAATPLWILRDAKVPMLTNHPKRCGAALPTAVQRGAKVWSAVAERSGDTALDSSRCQGAGVDETSKAVWRFASHRSP